MGWDSEKALKRMRRWLQAQGVAPSAGPEVDADLTACLQEAFEDAASWTGLILDQPSDPFVETLDGNGKSAISLRHWPVLGINSLAISGRDVPESTGYGLHGWYLAGEQVTPESPGSLLRLRHDAFTRGKGNVVVSVNAGMTQIPAQLLGALVEEAALRYIQPKHLGKQSDSGGKGSATYGDSQFTPGVKRVLDKFRVWRV